MNRKKQNRFKGSMMRIVHYPSFPSFVILLLLVFINALIQPNYFSYRLLKSNYMTFTPLIFAAIAQGIIILSGSIDLSLGSAIALMNTVTAFFMTDKNVFPMLMLGFAVTIIASGVINGLIVGRLKLAPLITTFATSAIYLGLAMMILPKAGGYVPRFLYNFYKGSLFGFLPNSIVILIAGLLIWYVFSRTAAYRFICAVGSNEEGAYASGISVWKIRFTAHLFAALFIFLAGLCVVMFTTTGDYRTGGSYTMNSIAAVVIGGIALTGGKGRITGAIWGAMILGTLNNIIFYSQASSYFQILAKGLIIVAALCIGVIPVLIRNNKKVKLGEKI